MNKTFCVIIHLCQHERDWLTEKKGRETAQVTSVRKDSAIMNERGLLIRVLLCQSILWVVDQRVIRSTRVVYCIQICRSSWGEGRNCIINIKWATANDKIWFLKWRMLNKENQDWTVSLSRQLSNQSANISRTIGSHDDDTGIGPGNSTLSFQCRSYIAELFIIAFRFSDQIIGCDQVRQ